MLVHPPTAGRPQRGAGRHRRRPGAAGADRTSAGRAARPAAAGGLRSHPPGVLSGRGGLCAGAGRRAPPVRADAAVEADGAEEVARTVLIPVRVWTGFAMR